MHRARIPLWLLGVGIAAVFIGLLLLVFDVATGRTEMIPGPDDPPRPNGDPITTHIALILGLLGTGIAAIGVLGIGRLWLLQQRLGRGS